MRNCKKNIYLCPIFLRKGLRRKKCLFLIHKLKRIGVDDSFSASGCIRDDFEVFPFVDYPHDMYL